MRRAHVVALVAAAALLAGGGALALARQGSAAPRTAGTQTTATRPLHRLRAHRLLRRVVRRRLGGAAASYVGIGRRELRSELRSGLTLAQVATAHGKTADGLVQELVTLVRGRLDRAVSRGRLTGAQEQALLTRLERRLDRLVNRTFG